MSEPRNCRKCGEDAIIVESGGKAMARVRRTSKCKGYVPPRKRWAFQKGFTCSTEICPTRQEAIDQWNDKFGTFICPWCGAEKINEFGLCGACIRFPLQTIADSAQGG